MLLLLLLFPVLVFSLDPADVLKKIDDRQRSFETMCFNANMEIVSRSRTLNKNFFGKTRNFSTNSDSFMEYLNPQDKGTRYLKLHDDLWIYIPDAQDVLKISGHLLSDGLMGSDISYSDILDQNKYAVNYNPSSAEITNIDGKKLYKLTLKAKNKDVSYVQQDLYTDENYLVQKVVMYAQGRDTVRAIKEFSLGEYILIDGIYFPTRMVANDLRKKNSQTIISYKEIKLNPTFDQKIFSRSQLEK
ncbi:MAG: outer membrane lipoprotein-sorting protein [Brevinema sp.]